MITAKDERWMKFAGKLLRQSDHPDYLFAAVVVRGGRVISAGVNGNRSAYRA